MKNTLNRVLVLLMILTLAVSVLPAAVFATGETADVLEGWNVVLGDNIGVKFHLDSADYTVTTTVNGTEVTPTISEEVVMVNVAAAQMTDIIGLTVKNGEETVHTGEYSVRQYAESILNGSYDSTTTNMVLQMLGYGAAAQSYFDYNLETLANAGYEDQISVADIPKTVEDTTVEGSVEGIKLYGMSLVFESKIAVRFYYSVSGSIDGYTFSDGVNTYEPQQKDGLYYVEVGSINPQDYGNVITMEVSDGTDKLSIGYSPLHYIVRMNGKGSESLKTLVQAMYSYHEAAVEYQEIANATVVELPEIYDMNVADSDFAVTDIALSGNLESVTVKGTELVLENAVLENNTLTIPAASFQLDNMPSGELTLAVVTDSKTIEVNGEFVWVISSWTELTKMDDHFVTADSVYTGSVAMGADIDATGKVIGNFLWNNGITNFNGTFDGRNHTVSGVNVKANMGLFRDLGADGEIKNLKLTNATVSTNGGALVGGATYGKVQNVYAQGVITADGMSASSNLANFGAGLLCGRIQNGATIDSCIVEMTSIADGLRLATAFGKMQQSSAKEEAVFSNCYAVNADGCTFMPYKDAEGNWNKVSFTEGGSNKNFATIGALWADNTAAQVAEKIGLVKPSVSITMENGFDMNSGSDFVVTDAALAGTVEGVTVKGTEIVLENAVLTDGMLTIPAASFQLDTMPSGELTLMVEVSGCSYEITGDFIWVINSASELLKMKNHMTTADETIYNGMFALGADIDLSGVAIKNNGMTGLTFAGTFDGRMHTLSNMNASAGNVGLFGDVSGTVRNLKVVNATVSSYTAAVAGGTLSGTLENIYVQGSITKDGMGENSNLANFGCGLLAARIQAGAEINNCIVELTSIADGLRLATAFGKMHNAAAAEEDVFSNCYAVGADGCTFMSYKDADGNWNKASFTEGGSNKNFADMDALWEDTAAAALAESFGLESVGIKELAIELDSAYDMNVAGSDLVIENAKLTGDLTSVTVQGTEIALDNATLADGVLTIPAGSFQLDAMPSGELTLEVITTKVNCTVTGEFIWVINSQEELFAMKNHLTKSGTVYSGSLALGADIIPEKYVTVNSKSGYYIFTKSETFAGVFDGRNHKIHKILAQTAEICLFPKVTGTIKNLCLTSAYVQACNSALVLELTGTIENVYVQGTIQKDGLSAYDNTRGCGLLACKIGKGAKIKSSIVDVTGFYTNADDNGIGSAYGKLLENVNAADVFENCYAVNADGHTYTLFNAEQSERASFAADGTNKNFATMAELWADTAAAALAEKLGLTQ